MPEVITFVAQNSTLEDMKKGLQIGLLAVVAVLLGVVAYGLMDKNNSTPTASIQERQDGPAAAATSAKPAGDTGKITAPDAASKDVPVGPTTTMLFNEYEWDFGVMDEGDKVEHIFKFTNTGDEPLILGNCKGSCGCTVPTCPKDPIQPGAEGEIKVVFNSRGKKNKQTKRVTITANTAPEPTTTLTISANVTPAPVEGEQ